MSNPENSPAESASPAPAPTAAPKKKKKGASLVDFTLVVVGIVIALGSHKSLGFLEAHTYDLRLAAAAKLAPVKTPSQSVLAPIDDDAVARYGRWPWSRDRWQPILRSLAELGATAAIFDVEFPEPSEPVLRRGTGGTSFLQVIQDNLEDVAPRVAPERLSEAIMNRLVESLREIQDAALGVLFEKPAKSALADEPPKQADPKKAEQLVRLKALAAKLMEIEPAKRLENFDKTEAVDERALMLYASSARFESSKLGEKLKLDPKSDEVLALGQLVEPLVTQAALDRVLSGKPDMPASDVVKALAELLDADAGDPSWKLTIEQKFLRPARARALVRANEQIPLGKLVDLLIDTVASMVASASSDVGIEVTKRLLALKGQLERVVRSPDADLASALVSSRVRGMPVYGVLYVSGGLSGDQARRDADLDEEVRSTLQKPVGERLTATHPGRMRDVYPRVLRGLTVSPLGNPEDPVFKQLGLTPEQVRAVLDGAREQVLGHALDIALRADPKMPVADVYAAVAKQFGLPNSAGLEKELTKLIAPARARAIVVSRFLIKPTMEKRRGADPLPDATTARTFTPPIPPLARTFSGIASSVNPPDPDGVMRRVPLFRRIEDGVLPGLSFELYLRQLGFSLEKPDDISKAITVEPGPVVRIQPPKGPEVRVPLDKSGSLLLRMQGKAEEVLEQVPLATVITYNGLKLERSDFHALKDTERVRDFYGPMGETADELILEGDAPITFDKLVEKSKAGGMIVSLPIEKVLKTEGADPKAARAPSEWRALLDAAYEAVLADYEKTLVSQLTSFRKRTEEQQKKALERPGSNWPEHIYRVSRLTELAHLKAELKSRLEGKSVVIGATMTGNTDAAATPFGPKEPNFALHGHGIATLMGGKFIRRPPHRDATLIPVIAVAFLLGLALPNVSLPVGAAFSLLLLVVWAGVSTALLAYYGLWVDMVAPGVSITATYFVLSVWRYKTVEQSKQIYRDMFEAYLDKRVIEQFVEQPELFKEIGGVSCEITAFFSDIEGFTTISELLSPEQLSAMLRDYLTPMTDIIQGRGGLRDKYIGDAIVAMFGAPLHTPDHAVQACLASIEQRARLDALKQDAKLLADPKSWLSHLKAKGRDFNARMGVNTGLAKVGNFGSETSKNYTMIGDTVNLAARLEGANKAFGTYLMISEFTYAQAKDYIEARPLDSIRVKGKLRPVTVYELMAKKGGLTQQMEQVRAIFVEARNLYLEQRWDEAIARFQDGLKIKPDDAPCLTLMHRSEHFKEEPPAKDWDGTYDLKEK